MHLSLLVAAVVAVVKEATDGLVAVAVAAACAHCRTRLSPQAQLLRWLSAVVAIGVST